MMKPNPKVPRILDDQLVNECLIDQGPEILTYGIGAARYVLQHEDANELFLRINPRVRASPTTPTMSADRCHNAGLGSIDQHAET